MVELNRYWVADPRGLARNPEGPPAAAAVAEEQLQAVSMYRELATAAESGWFSSRWVPVQDVVPMSVAMTTATAAMPMYLPLEDPADAGHPGRSNYPASNGRNLQGAHNLVAATTRSAAEVSGHHMSQALHYEAAARQRRAAIEAVLWSEADGRWRDAWLVMPTALDRGIEGTAKGIGSEYKGEGGSGRGGPRNAEGNDDGRVLQHRFNGRASALDRRSSRATSCLCGLASQLTSSGAPRFFLLSCPAV